MKGYKKDPIYFHFSQGAAEKGVREGVKKKEMQQGVCVLVLSCREAPEEQWSSCLCCWAMERESKGNQSSASQENTELQQLQELPAWLYCCSGRKALQHQITLTSSLPFLYQHDRAQRGGLEPCTISQVCISPELSHWAQRRGIHAVVKNGCVSLCLGRPRWGLGEGFTESDLIGL